MTTLGFSFFHSSITTDPIQGHLYWSTMYHENKGQIFKSWMDGTHKVVLINASDSADMRWPSSLTIDGSKLYWCDLRTRTIESFDLIKEQRNIMFDRGLNDNFYPFSMAYHNGNIYYTDTSIGNITKIDIKTKYVTQ